MKILNPRDKFLSNYEVSVHLNEIKKKNNWTFKPDEDTSFSKKKKRFTACGLDLEVITRDLSSYLNSSPCSVIKDPDSFTELLKFLNEFDLMKIEKLQIVNSLPRTMVCLYAVVEEFDSRFDEDTCDKIIGKINELFPVEGANEEEGEEEGKFEDAEDTPMEG
ncbi:DNA-directed RNA polymerase III subunit RPC9 [[Candida] railenensis]|uniref:DNA-directed RNA polymerase III subunit RPC9 n=1 Tax=[Candida] railenensis TaxID=45579 RepID=A0A9P0QS74_9ASCO|nr:DNA-directed RNA polymerase III subunit RPC9 [[Candida] railenensis]